MLEKVKFQWSWPTALVTVVATIIGSYVGGKLTTWIKSKWENREKTKKAA